MFASKLNRCAVLTFRAPFPRTVFLLLASILTATTAFSQDLESKDSAGPVKIQISSSGIIVDSESDLLEYFVLVFENSSDSTINNGNVKISCADSNVSLSQSDFEFVSIEPAQIAYDNFTVRSSVSEMPGSRAKPRVFKVSVTCDGVMFDYTLEVSRGTLAGKLSVVPLILMPAPGETKHWISAYSRVDETLSDDPFARFSLPIDLLKDPRLGSTGLDPATVMRAIREGKIEPVVYLSNRYGELGTETVIRDILRQQKQNFELAGKPARTAVAVMAGGPAPQLAQVMSSSGIRGMIGLFDTIDGVTRHGRAVTISSDGSRLDTYLWEKDLEIRLPTFPDENALVEMGRELGVLRAQSDASKISVIETTGRSHGLGTLLWNNKIRAPRMAVGVASSCFDSPGIARDSERINEITFPSSYESPLTDVRLKRGLAAVPALVRDAEAWATLAWMHGADFPQGEIDYCWNLLSTLDSRTDKTQALDNLLKLQRCGVVAQDVLESSLDSHLRQYRLRPFVLQSGDDVNQSYDIAVFNSCPWVRTDVVRVGLPDNAMRPTRVFDPSGRIVPFSLVVANEKSDLIFVGRDLPAMGFRVYSLDNTEAASSVPDTSTSGPPTKDGRLVIENEFFRVTSDSPGRVKSIWDKRAKKELLGAGRYGGMELIAGLSGDADASILWRSGEGVESFDIIKDDLSERLVFRGTYRGARWQEDIVLWADVPRVDVTVRFFDSDYRIPNMKMGLDLMEDECAARSGYSDALRLVDASSTRKWEQLVELGPATEFSVRDESGKRRVLSKNVTSVEIIVEAGKPTLVASASRIVDMFSRHTLKIRAVTTNDQVLMNNERGDVRIFLGDRFKTLGKNTTAARTPSGEQFFFRFPASGQSGALLVPDESAEGVAAMCESFLARPGKDAWSMAIASTDVIDFSLSQDGELLLGLTSSDNLGSPSEMFRVYDFSILSGPHTDSSLRHAAELISPVRSVAVEPVRATVPLEKEMLRVGPAQLVVSAFKPSIGEGGAREAVVRVINGTSSSVGSCVLTTQTKISKAWKANLIEEKWRPLDVVDGKVVFSCPPYSVETIGLQSSWPGENIRTHSVDILGQDRPLYTRYWLTGGGPSLMRNFVSVTFAQRVAPAGKTINTRIRITNHDLLNNTKGNVRFVAPAGWRISPPHGIMYDLLPGGSVTEKVRIVTSGKSADGIVRANYDVQDLTFYDSLIIGEPEPIQVRPSVPRVVVAPGQTVKVSFQITNPLEQPLTAAVALTGGPLTWGGIDPRKSVLDIKGASRSIELRASGTVTVSFDVSAMTRAPFARIPLRLKTSNDGYVKVTEPVTIEISG